ncbi:MAG: hypothetical protein ACI9P5_004526 [Saprospiraceae bacterium]|jgi:hypothetical protein
MNQAYLFSSKNKNDNSNESYIKVSMVGNVIGLFLFGVMQVNKFWQVITISIIE